MDIFSNLISSFDPKKPNFRPTEIYNENWLIKIILNQASTIDDDDHPLGFLPGSTWYSEGQMPTVFKSRYRGDPLGESRTHADGVIGDIRIGEKAKVDLELDRKARQFTVIEAKIGAGLSSGTKNAPDFDQAARNVACMAEVMNRAKVNPPQLDRLNFIVLAPGYSIAGGIFSKEMKRSSIQAKVRRRVLAYEGKLDWWYANTFEPVMDKIQVHTLSWGEVIDWISKNNPENVGPITKYYKSCLEFNSK